MFFNWEWWGISDEDILELLGGSLLRKEVSFSGFGGTTKGNWFLCVRTIETGDRAMKKTGKRIVAWILAFAMAATLAPESAFAQEYDSGETSGEREASSSEAMNFEDAESFGEMTLSEDKVIDGNQLSDLAIDYEVEVIEDSEGNESVRLLGYVGEEAQVTVPAEIGGYPVTEIGASVFCNNTTVTEVAVSNGVTSIGNSAFYGCTNLAGVRLPESLTSIEGAAFQDCSGLTEIILPDGVTSIGFNAFYGCSSLTNVSIPASVTDIGEAHFMAAAV